MKAASCFSGIGAPEMGGPQFDWLWHAEIEKFPAAVMDVRFPHSVNLGDVTAEDFMQRASSFGQLDLLVGGPPCQAFSVAGLRRSMQDDRGNLSLRFVRIAHAIRPRNLLVENVPGWLNTPDNAFGCFLGAILGADDALRSPADGKWPGVGMASGPLGRLCWATLDAQWFGVAQRRRRVFVVVDFGDGADPCSVLFEPEGVRRHSPPRREAGQGTAGTISARTQGGGGLGTDFELGGGIVHCHSVAPTLNTHLGDKQGLEDQHINGGCGHFIAHSLRGEGYDATDDLSPTLRSMGHADSHANGGGQVAIAFAHQEGGDQTTLGFDPESQTSMTLGANQTPAVAFAENQQGNVYEMDVCQALNRGGGKPGQSYPAIRQDWQVRRLTPTECERLQGFPDGFTDITYRGKPAADGPRYKALGNSWAVPCGAWIIGRIADGLIASDVERAA